MSISKDYPSEVPTHGDIASRILAQVPYHPLGSTSEKLQAGLAAQTHATLAVVELLGELVERMDELVERMEIISDTLCDLGTHVENLDSTLAERLSALGNTLIDLNTTAVEIERSARQH